MNFMRTVVHRLIQINILMSLLTSVWCGEDAKLITSHSVTKHLKTHRTSTALKDDLKKKLVGTQTPTSTKSSISKHSSVSSTVSATASVTKAAITTKRTSVPKVSSSVSSIKIATSSSKVIPAKSSSIHIISNKSTEVTKRLSTSLHTVYLSSSIVSSSSVSTKVSKYTSVPTDILNSTVTTSKVVNATSTTTQTNRSNITPSFVVNSTIIANSTSSTLINISTSVNFSSLVYSTIAPSLSPTVVANITSPVHPGNATSSPSTFVMSSTFVCPTTTIYMNCSSDYITITPSTPSVVNITSSVVNITSSVVNLTSSVNISSVHVASTVVSISNLTSSSYATSVLTTAPAAVSTSVFNSTSVLPTAISSIINITSSSTVVYSSAHIIIPPLRKCDLYLSEFTDAHTDLSKCILNNMHPMRVCSNCSVAYEIFSNNHKKIFNDCGEVLIYDYNMQYQVIPKMFAAQDMTWKSLECDKCYTRDGAGVTQYSPKFKAYIELYNELNKCFKNHTHDSWVRLPNNTIRNTTYDKAICSDCYNLYHTMQVNYEYYGDNGEDSPTEWCADINVAVNETRHKWSNDFKCGKKEKDLESVIALTCFFCFLPIVFYVGAKLHADVRERKSANRYNYDSE